MGISNQDGAFRSSYRLLVFTGLGRNAGAILRRGVKLRLTMAVRKKGEMSLKLAEEKERQLVDSMCNFATRVLAGEHKDEAELAILPEIAKILLNYCSFSIWRQ